MKSHLAVEECVSMEFPFARCLAFFVVAVLMLLLGSPPVQATTRYVNLSNPAPASPFTSWASAATNIQDAVNAAAGGDEVVVTNGVYATGGQLIGGLLTNRVVVDKPIMLRSVNGPAVTVIQGNQVEGTTNGDGAVRCVFLTTGSVLSGFTVANGGTRTGGDVIDTFAGGIYCLSGAVVVSNCTIVGNTAFDRGGGVFQGTLYNCRVVRNRARQGGGTSWTAMENCTLIGNSATFLGGGASPGVAPVRSCTIVSNTADAVAGGVLISGESSYGIANCIVYYNTAPSGANCVDNSRLARGNCSDPLLVGTGNITNEPAFVDLAGGNIRLQSGSACINTGINSESSYSIDLDGRPRIVDVTIDMGAYEFQGHGMSEFIGWLQQFGLPTDGSADASDADDDRASNWQEWRAGTEPTNPQSVLRMLTPVLSGADEILTWESVPGRSYTLERGIDFGIVPSFLPIFSNVVSQGATTTVTDTNAAGGGPKFYRVGVE